MDWTAISDELNDHGFDDASDERKLAVINDTLWDVLSRAPWPFLEATIDLTFSGSSVTASNFPTSAFRAAYVMEVTAGGAGNSVHHMRYDDWLRRYGNNPQTGIPLYYYFVGNEMRFYPTPSANVVVTMGYLKQQTALAASFAETDILLPAQFHRSVLVNGALFKLYAMEDDTDIAPTFETYYERGIQNMREQLMRKQYTDNDTIESEFDNPWSLG